MAADSLYGNVLGQSPRFDWRRLRDTAGPQRWARMCDLALLVIRYAGQWGLPLANAGEFELLHWLVYFGHEEQRAERFEAQKNLIETANCLPSDGYLVELHRCVHEGQWLLGPWIIEGLDRLCAEVLEEAALAGGVEADPPLPLAIATGRKPKTPRYTAVAKATASAISRVLSDVRPEDHDATSLVRLGAEQLQRRPWEGLDEIRTDSKATRELAESMLNYHKYCDQNP